MSERISISEINPKKDVFLQIYNGRRKGTWVIRHPTQRDQEIVIGKLLSQYDIGQDSFFCEKHDKTILERMEAWKRLNTPVTAKMYAKAAATHPQSSDTSSESSSAEQSDTVIDYAYEGQVPVRVLVLQEMKNHPQGAHYTEIARAIQKPEGSVSRIINPNNTNKLHNKSLPWRDPHIVFVGSGIYIDRSFIHPRRLEKLAEAIAKRPRAPPKEDILAILQESVWDASLARIFDNPNFNFRVLDVVEDQYILPRLKKIKEDQDLIQFFQTQGLEADKIIQRYFEKYQAYRVAMNTPYISRKKVSATKKNGGVLPHFQGFPKEQQQNLMKSFYEAAEARELSKLTLKTCPLIQKGFIRLYNKVGGDMQQFYQALDEIKDYRTVLQESNAKTISSAKINLELWLLTYGGDMVTNYLAIREIFQNNSKIRLVPTDDQIISALQSNVSLEEATAKLLETA